MLSALRNAAYRSFHSTESLDSPRAMYVFTWTNGRPKAAQPVSWAPMRDALAECARVAHAGAIPTKLKEACVNMSSKDMMSRSNCLAVLDSLEWMKEVWTASQRSGASCVFKTDPRGLFKYLGWVRDLNACLIPPEGTFKPLKQHREDLNRAKAIFEEMTRTAQVLEDMYLDKRMTWTSANILKPKATFVSCETLQALKNCIAAHEDMLDRMEEEFPGSTRNMRCGAGCSGKARHARTHARTHG